MLKKFTGNRNISKKKQTAGRFCSASSSATHTVRGGGASKASDGGEKNLITGT